MVTLHLQTGRNPESWCLPGTSGMMGTLALAPAPGSELQSSSVPGDIPCSWWLLLLSPLLLPDSGLGRGSLGHHPQPLLQPLLSRAQRLGVPAA